MHQSFVFSGFGGQGALFAGQVLTYAAMDTGRHVTWIPSYGPEMRGGVARCTVIVSDEEIGSPIVRKTMAGFTGEHVRGGEPASRASAGTVQRRVTTRDANPRARKPGHGRRRRRGGGGSCAGVGGSGS